MLPRSFYFLRHGETDWNKIGRLQGHTDIPLNDTGREQAKNAIPFLKELPIHRIISSSLLRAYETAQIINAVLQLPLESDDRLKEKFFGIYEGMTGAEIDAWKLENPDGLLIEKETGYTSPPGAETYQEIHDRIFNVKNELLEKYPDENILFVSHGGVYRTLCRALTKDVNQSPNARPYHFLRNAPMEWSLIDIQK